MRWFKVNGLLDTLRPVYLASNILLVNFTSYNFATRTVHRTLFDLTRFVFTLLLDVFLTWRAIQACQAFLKGTESMLINAGLYGSIVLNFLLTSSIPLWNSLNGTAIFEMFQGIEACNDELQPLGVWIDLQKRHLAFTVYAVLSTSNGFFVLIINWFFPSVVEKITVPDMFPDGWAILALSRTNFISGISSCYSTLTLLAIRKYFNLLNQTVA
ncbi:Gustatory receptor 28b [Culex quinquefasciatus]|uniref:Gustatory receptor 28b n=1 Tax=Culex quinquefasciatus TaxID=7176 RepID=B0X8W5_CULQU|nr:Gustatory receptor 28b [Culex quinquefasciatus]|eukprot:XP_001866087.1 Gustatory receptor 28b [Culex quinquefasciatus]